MEKSNKNHILMRYLVVVIAMLFFSGFIVYKMFKTTVVFADAWNAKADSVWRDTATIQPERGKILADNGAVLAANLYTYTPRIDWQYTGFKQADFDKALPALCDSLSAFDGSRSPLEWKNELLQAKEKKSRYYKLFEPLSHSQYLRLRTFPFFDKCKKMLYYERKMERCYPFGKMAARSIGRIHLEDKTGAVHGITGLESALDSLLYGVPARAPRVQLNINTTNWGAEATRGYDVTTTINIQLQDIVEEQLYDMLQECKGKWGTAILMQVQTGEIKAISNFDWSDKVGDYIEGENHAVLGYEPGSVMKPISMMVALEDGIVKDINAPIPTGSVWKYAGGEVKDTHGAADALTPVQIIERSSNVGMSRIIASRYGTNPDGFRQRLEGMGFFQPMNMGIAGQRLPRFPKLGNANRDRIALTRMAFGYSTEIPPMSTLAIFNAFANDGKYVCPRLVTKLSREDCPDSIMPVRYLNNQVCSKENAQKLREMLQAVVWGEHGTARAVQDSVVRIAGKTGTAHILDKSGQYSSLKRYAFCGFFPYEKPLYTCMVLIYGGSKTASTGSGTVLKNIALKMYARGLLNNQSDFTQGNKDVVRTPHLSATNNSNRQAELTAAIDVKSASSWANHSNQSDNKGIPNVVGLAARDAVARLEKLGLVVKCTGAGYVCRQNLAPGTAYKKGDIVRLALTNRSK